MGQPETAQGTSSPPPPVPVRRPEGCPFDLPERLGELQRSCPVTRVSIWDGSEPWLVTRYADVRTVLGDPRFSSDAREPGYPSESAAMAEHRRSSPMMLTVDPPEHTRLRRAFAKTFLIRDLEQLRPSIQGIVDELIDGMLAGPQPAEFTQALAAPIPGRVVSGLLGIDQSHQAHFQRLVTIVTDTATPPAQAAAANAELGEFLAEHIAAKSESPGPDLISRIIVDHERTGEITRDEVVANTRLLVFAGFETTVNQMGLALLTLLEHPEQLAELRADPSLLPAAIEELIRYTVMDQYPRPRVAKEDVEIGGQLIRAGEGVLVSLAAANRDADRFPEPERFDIHRDGARTHLGFSFGPHQCLGQALARMEIQVLFETLIRRVPTLRLAVPREGLRFKSTQVMNGVEELPLAW
jgi:cytochrome P450